MLYDLSYSFHLYNIEGEHRETCILLHLGNGIILKFKDLDSLDKFIVNMADIRDAIEHTIDNALE